VKSIKVQLLLVFLAGAGCATVVMAGLTSPPGPTTAGELQVTMGRLLVDLETVGGYSGVIFEDSRLGIYTDPAACAPTPRPKQPYGSVDSRNLQYGAQMLIAYNQAIMAGEKDLVLEIGKCRPVHR